MTEISIVFWGRVKTQSWAITYICRHRINKKMPSPQQLRDPTNKVSFKKNCTNFMLCGSTKIKKIS